MIRQASIPHHDRRFKKEIKQGHIVQFDWPNEQRQQEEHRKENRQRDTGGE